MISDKQFEDAFTAAGGWFFLTQFELIKAWEGSKAELVDMIYSKGKKKKRTGSNTRVSSSIRIRSMRGTFSALSILRQEKL